MAELVRGSSDTSFLVTRLERAAQRAHDHWFPSNPELIQKIQAGLRDGHYDLDIEFLLNEIRTDLSLFAFCIKEAILLLRTEAPTSTVEMNPFSILRAAGLQKIRKIIDKCEQRISTHSLTTSTPAQQSRLKEAMISASTAEAMAPFHEIEAEIGFSAAVLRQLGLALLAWNYPTVYQRALERSDTSITLEAALNEALGFSPTVFGTYILSKWGINPSLKVVVGTPAENDNPEPLEESQLYLKKICEVGESLARAQSPEFYPTAQADWESAKAAIESTIGPDGMRQVNDLVRRNCESYRSVLKDGFADTAQLNTGAKIIALREEQLFERNPYIKGCSAAVKKAFRELYASMDPRAISQHSVRVLTSEIIPLAGFSGGCVFVLDPSSKNFMPRLTLGAITLRTPGPVIYSEYSTRHDPVIVAYECQAPMIEHSRNGGADDCVCVAAALGSKPKLGVLYLEMPQMLFDDADYNALVHFKAVRKALEDALHCG